MQRGWPPRRGYGATVTEIYSPNATWSRVVAAANGANVLIDMGHGNGSPSPYAPFQENTKDGLGLNATANHGDLNVKYYGATLIKSHIHLAKNSVVILRGMCYTAGNSEPGNPIPSVTAGRQRIDNFAAGFLKIGARDVFAEPYGDVGYILQYLFTGKEHGPRDLPVRAPRVGHAPVVLVLADAGGPDRYGQPGHDRPLPALGHRQPQFGDQLRSLTSGSLPRSESSGLPTQRTGCWQTQRPVLPYPLRIIIGLVVGAAGFEPTISCSQSTRDAKLRYAPVRPTSTILDIGSRAIRHPSGED